MNVVSLLAKMRVDLDDSDIKVAGTQSEEQPVQHKGRRITYEFRGKVLPDENLE